MRLTKDNCHVINRLYDLRCDFVAVHGFMSKATASSPDFIFLSAEYLHHIFG